VRDPAVDRDMSARGATGEPDQRSLLVKAGVLIDGRGGAIARRVDVLITGRSIAAVGPIGSLRPPPGTTEIDASTSTVIPGLVDAHHHVTYSGHVGMQELEWPNSLEFSAISAGANASLALACGYTSALDVGCRGRIGVAARAAIAKGTIRGPDLRVSGQIITTVGGPLDAWPSSMRPDPATRLTVLVSGADEIRRAIREQAKDGVDNVKLQLSWSTVQRSARGRTTTFTTDELAAATEMAHHHGLSIAAHAEGPESITDAVEAGFDTVQHASFIDERTIGLLDAHPDCRLVFTLGVYDDIRMNGPLIGYPPSSIARVEETWPAMVAGVRLAYERGVPFAVGSDCGGKVHPQGRYARDVVLLVRACGLPVEHAIRAATDHAARAAWFSDIGRIAPGVDADLAVVRGDLSAQIELLEDEANVDLVIQKGRIVKDRMTAGAAAGY
jgi:imidazolonepropionase-like amidohydrolase